MKLFMNFKKSARFCILLVGLSAQSNAQDKKSFEEKAIEFAKKEKPIDDTTWKTIASTHLTETYPILKGDTLSGVSKRLFGDSNYWPKLWAVNNKKIFNPHMLKPGQVLIFNSGNGFTEPSLTLGNPKTIQAALGSSIRGWDGPISPTDTHTPKRSNDWMKISKTLWSKSTTQLGEGYDKDGFDKKNFKQIKKSLGYELPLSISDTPLSSLGSIVSAPTEFKTLTMGDAVLLRSQQEMKANEIYEIISPAEVISTSNKNAYVYWNVGQLKIKGTTSEGYTAEIIKSRNPILRGDTLLVAKTKTAEPQMIAAPEGISARIYHSKQDRIAQSSQNQWVILDEGSEKGLAPGMVLNSFQTIDQYTRHHLKADDVFIQSQIKVFECTVSFCLGKVEWSKEGIETGSFASAITNLSELKFKTNWNSKNSSTVQSTVKPTEVKSPEELRFEQTPEATTPSPSVTTPLEPATTPTDERDWLDDLDDQKDLNPSEEDELRKLEEYKEQSPIPTAPPTLDDAATELLNEPQATTPGAPQIAPVPEPTPVPSPVPAPESTPAPSSQLEGIEPIALPESGLPEQAPPPLSPEDDLPLE